MPLQFVFAKGDAIVMMMMFSLDLNGSAISGNVMNALPLWWIDEETDLDRV